MIGVLRYFFTADIVIGVLRYGGIVIGVLTGHSDRRVEAR